MKDRSESVFLSDQQPEAFNIKEYIQKLLRAWPIGVLGLAFSFCLAIIYLLYVVPQYHINAKILIQDDKKTGGQAGATMMDLTSLLGGKSSVDNEVEVLNTRYLMDRLVRDKQLNFTWYQSEGIKTRELDKDPFWIEVYELSDSIRGTTFDFVIQDERSFELKYEDPIDEIDKEVTLKFDTPFDLPHFGRLSINRIGKLDNASLNADLSLNITSVDAKVEAMKGALSVSTTNKLASIIDVQLDYPLPAKGERILKGFIDEYIQQDIRDKSRIADSTIKFIDERILLVNQELNGIEGNIQTFMQGRGLANISEQAKLLLESNTDYIKQLSEIENKIQVMNAVERLLNEPGNQRLVSGSILADDQTFMSLLSSYNSLNLERERLLLSYTPDNPFVTNIDQRINSVKENILKYIQSTRNNLQVSKQEIERNTGKIRGNIRDVPAQERQFLDLSRQQQLKQELYLYLLQKREETAVANTSNIAGIRVIDPPKAEYLPFSPKKRMILAAAFLFALAIPVAYVYAQDLLNTKVQNRKDVEKRTKLPIIGEFTHNPTAVDLIEFKSSRSALAEQFRALRTNLQFMLPKPTDKVILVTSGMPGEGKSFTSLNLANVYAYSGKEVLLLEFDLRKPKLSKTYTGLSSVGISNYIVDQSLSLDDMINTVGDTGNLYFGACGPIPPNPAELIMSERVEQMIQEARERFDIIIIDAPPLGAVTDGQLLSTYADVTLHLVRANYTPHELIGLPEDMRREAKIKNMAIILNDVSENAGGYYGYNYGYYHAEETKGRWWKFRKN
ncbi:MAG: polysaccharide biosynthesis tyrosine autokinase [Pseudosphingobacterium sp.]|nr:polysaccharide biosynthesis tyrosine autokinase [Olivibacter sp. UJ_SKK_5.1]MDX3912698.1 polysaccharide biosynthesis tyrosine autokinase [Pseudosphingobacterium sp.]